MKPNENSWSPEQNYHYNSGSPDLKTGLSNGSNQQTMPEFNIYFFCKANKKPMLDGCVANTGQQTKSCHKTPTKGKLYINFFVRT